jgi:DNA-binding beta-propeller fold protein YncE
LALALITLMLGCRGAMSPAAPGPTVGPGNGTRLPLTQVADADLPGHSTRFDYQEIDAARGRLVVAHMNDGEVLVLDLRDGSVLGRARGIPTVRGVAIAGEVGRIFATSSPQELAIIDDRSFTILQRATTGSDPDGVAWDPAHKVVGVSDQGDGAISLLADAGDGARTQLPLGNETGNVVYDAGRSWFWITVVGPAQPDRLVAVDPVAQKVATSIGLPGCSGAHGLHLHPDGKSAFIACEGNNVLARVDLGGSHAISTAATGSGPDVLALDPGLGWLYVAAESGDLTVFDLNQPGVALIGHDQPGASAHSVAVDPATHRVFFPLVSGASGSPVLRIMRPTATP